jgi:hypothetical protein
MGPAAAVALALHGSFRCAGRAARSGSRRSGAVLEAVAAEVVAIRSAPLPRGRGDACATPALGAAFPCRNSTPPR